MKKWKNIKIEEELMKQIEKVKNEKHFKSKSKFLEDAVNEKLKRIKDEDTKDRLADIQEFLEKNSITLKRKGINNIVDLTSTTLSNSEAIKKLEARIDDYEQTTRDMIATVDQDQLKIFTHEEMKKMLKEIEEQQDKMFAKARRSRKQS